MRQNSELRESRMISDAIVRLNLLNAMTGENPSPNFDETVLRIPAAQAISLMLAASPHTRCCADAPRAVAICAGVSTLRLERQHWAAALASSIAAVVKGSRLFSSACGHHRPKSFHFISASSSSTIVCGCSPLAKRAGAR